ncbi:uncharacterized protein [Dysidea avara]|uniref:uncharacterized protein n=1 Tax=Dysidea avara TaxID=196820 RepID=UPI003331A97D
MAQIWTCDGGPRQQWMMDSQSLKIELKSDGNCLDITNWSKDNGANIYLRECHPDDQLETQKWSYDPVQHTLTSKMNGKCLDGSPLGGHTNVQQRDCNGGKSQEVSYKNDETHQEKYQYVLNSGCTIQHIAPFIMGWIKQNVVFNDPFSDTTLDVAARVKDLISRMHLNEKISQLGNTAASVARLTIPSYQWWSEALHGIAGSPGVDFGGQIPSATSFPQVINLGATFDMPLIYEMAKAISTEARAMYNQGRAGLTYFAPNINLYRDPRWGRGQETPGEDPYLISQYVINFAHGMQEDNANKFLKTVVTCKHFAVYGKDVKMCTVTMLWCFKIFLDRGSGRSG